jgi:hypothetical protein
MARYYSGQNQPLTNWNNLPIYLTTILTAVLVAALIVQVIAESAGFSLARLLAFSMPLIPGWSLWRLITHVLVQQISFFTPFALLCFYWWSVGVETHMGRAVLSKLLLVLALTTPAVGAVWWWVFHVPSGSLGSYAFTSGLLIAFTTLYPNTEAWGWIPFKWLAFACITCGSLMLLASHAWVELSQLWASCAVGFAYMRHANEKEHDDYESPFQRLSFWFKSRKFKVVKEPGAAPARQFASAAGADAQSEVDRLLDKIAKSGLASLSAKERSQLEKASEELSRKDKR